MFLPHFLLFLSHSSKLYLMTKDAKHILKCLLAICVCTFETVQFTGSLAGYPIGDLVFNFCSPYTSDTLDPSDTELLAVFCHLRPTTYHAERAYPFSFHGIPSGNSRLYFLCC